MIQTMNSPTAAACRTDLESSQSNPSELIMRRQLTRCDPSIESLRNCDPSISRTHRSEEIEEKCRRSQNSPGGFCLERCFRQENVVVARRSRRHHQLIASVVSANSFFSESQAKAAARANLPARTDITMYTVSG